MVTLRNTDARCRCNGCGKIYIAGETTRWYNHFFCSPGCCNAEMAKRAPKEEDYEDFEEYMNAKNRFWRR